MEHSNQNFFQLVQNTFDVYHCHKKFNPLHPINKLRIYQHIQLYTHNQCRNNNNNHYQLNNNHYYLINNHYHFNNINNNLLANNRKILHHHHFLHLFRLQIHKFISSRTTPIFLHRLNRLSNLLLIINTLSCLRISHCHLHLHRECNNSHCRFKRQNNNYWIIRINKFWIRKLKFNNLTHLHSNSRYNSLIYNSNSNFNNNNKYNNSRYNHNYYHNPLQRIFLLQFRTFLIQ